MIVRFQKTGSLPEPQSSQRVLHKISYQVLAMLLCIPLTAHAAATPEPGYIPFSRDCAVVLLQKTVESKLIPITIQGDGMTLTVTKLMAFSMDWEKGQFGLDCAFTADYNKGIIKLNQSGEVSLTGNGLLSSAEQKLGAKLVRIEKLKLEHTPNLVNEAVRALLNKSLSGKEMWRGSPPATSEPLTQDNFGTLLKVALAQQLPLSGSNDNSSFTLTRLDELTLMPEPGLLQARFGVKGTHKELLTISFEGVAGVAVRVMVNPDELSGIIRINEVTELKLESSPGFLGGIIRALVNKKLKGKEIPFSWK